MYTDTDMRQYVYIKILKFEKKNAQPVERNVANPSGGRGSYPPPHSRSPAKSQEDQICLMNGNHQQKLLE